ncbi:hypothetical protein KF840_12490 [bacterium]|nr:hypothetical protein [bacterium]
MREVDLRQRGSRVSDIDWADAERGGAAVAELGGLGGGLRRRLLQSVLDVRSDAILGRHRREPPAGEVSQTLADDLALRRGDFSQSLIEGGDTPLIER